MIKGGNKYPSIWQIVDTYGIRKLQNNGKAPTRLLVSITLANQLHRELADELRISSRPSIGQCTDFLGMGVRIVADSSINGKFEIDYVPIEHNPYNARSGNGSNRHTHWSSYTEEFFNRWYDDFMKNTMRW